MVQGIIDYLLLNKTAYVDKVQSFVEEQYDITVSWLTIQRAIKAAYLTRKVIGKHI
jgi:hypothetical protein